MTVIRSLILGSALIGAIAFITPVAMSQTTPRTSGRPAAGSPQDPAEKSATTKKAAPITSAAAKQGAAGGTKSGQSTPIPSTNKAKSAPPAEDDEVPRTATRPNSATKTDIRPDSKSAIPPGTKTPEARMPELPTPVAPSWQDKITPDEVKYIDDVLKYWETSTSKVKTYKCDFDKFTYNPNFAPPGTHYEYSTGVIMYAQPDKGLYRVDEINRYRPAKDKDGKSEYLKAEGEKGEHWICDGKAVFYFDYLNKILRKTNLPPVMQGKAIADGPLPFVFGAEAEKIKKRYWLHVVTPPNAKDEIRLAAVPKLREDAANYKEILIVIDHESFLPKAMTVFMPGYDAKTNPAKDTYVFKKRQNNLTDALWLPLAKEFYQPTTPSGWKLEEQEVPRDEVPRTASSNATAPTKRPVAPAPKQK